jgi:large subunit ribosomal protein L13
MIKNTQSRKREKIELDAAGQVVGRMASKIAMILMGKHKPDYVAHIDTGDRVVVKNITDLRFTGKKLEQKVYRHHSMHPGGLKEVLAKKVVKDDPRKILLSAVSKMLPKNKMRTGRMLRISFKK